MISKLKTYKYLALLLLIISVILASFKSPQIEIDTDIGQFFHEDDSDFQFYQKVK